MTANQINETIATAIRMIPHKPTEEELARGSYYQYEPNYFYSIDSCRAFEDSAGPEYWREVESVVDRANGNKIVAFAVGKATAPQRCEAFLRWKELWL